jgi:uncharacterized protein (TIGR02246 family)
VTAKDAPILQMLAAYKAAVHARDVDAFCALYADDVHIFELWRQWSHHGIAAWRAMATGWFGSLGDERVIVEIDDVRTIVSGDMASATAFLTYRAIAANGEELRSLDNRLSWVLCQQAGRWQVVHEHTSIPIDGESGKGLFRRSATA